jgi:chromosome segregation ATPase
MAESGLIPRQASQDAFGVDRRAREYFILTYENAELKQEKERLTQELAEATKKLESDTAVQTARLEAVIQVYDQQILTLKDNLVTAETQLQLAELQEDIAQQRAEKEAITQDLSKAFRDKDELTAKYLSCREETLRLHKELAELVVKSSSLEHEVVLYRSRVEELESKPTQGSESDSVLSLQLESLEIERHTLSLKARISELEYEVKDKEEWVLRASLQEAQTKELRNRLVRAKGDQARRDQILTQLKREKEELKAALLKERRVLRDALVEVTGTMQEIHGLVDIRGSTT